MNLKQITQLYPLVTGKFNITIKEQKRCVLKNMS